DDKKILIITNGVFAEDPAPYDRVIDMFDGAAEESLGAACARWKRYKDAGCELHYYQQTASGGWDKKAA
ncbi:MAG: DNA polymerase III subunit chi, partial [Alphaproteobacteria bacterium]|nr:DNA polymerase III subunit chi [Alphaproteobacteria bacterium]